MYLIIFLILILISIEFFFYFKIVDLIKNQIFAYKKFFNLVFNNKDDLLIYSSIKIFFSAFKIFFYIVICLLPLLIILILLYVNFIDMKEIIFSIKNQLIIVFAIFLYIIIRKQIGKRKL